MTHDPFAEWAIDEGDYPSAGSAADKLRYLVGYAILAPSSHNTQPWLFRIAGDRLELMADLSRRLPVVDPEDRALVISCGAALAVLLTAMRHFGHAGETELLPDGSDSNSLATVGLGPAHVPTAADNARFGAITRRRTTRLEFEDEALPPGLAEELIGLASGEGAEVAIVTERRSKSAVARLVAKGDRAQFANSDFRAELASWVHSRRSASRDGMSGANFGMPDILSAVGGLVIRTFDMGDGIASKDEEIAAGSPALVLVATAGDAPIDWLRAGMAHIDMLLAVTAAGLTAAYLNQPVEVARLRPALRRAAHASGVPQLLFRIGRAPEIAPAVRRSVESVLAAQSEHELARS